MITLVFTLPNGRRGSHGAYARAWRMVRASAPDVSVRGFDHFPMDARDVHAALIRGLHERISRHDRTRGHGRKWGSDYQMRMARDAYRVNDAARGIRWNGRNLLDTPELKARFPRIDNPPIED